MIPIGINDGQATDLPPSSDGNSVTVAIGDLPGMLRPEHDTDQAVAEFVAGERTRNAGFVQVSKAYIDEMNSLAQQDRSAHHILWTLIKLMNKQNAVMISQESLAQLTKFSRPTIKRAVAQLRSQQWLEVLKMGTANIYRVNAEVVWQDKAGGKWAAFNARVIVNFDEQDAITHAMPSVRTRHIPFVLADDLTGPAAPDDGGRQ